MAKRKRQRTGGILDGIAGAEMTVMEWISTPRSKRVDPDPVCCCAPPQRNRLGGCRPGLKRVGDQLEPICQTCLKSLRSGIHRRRDQTHAIGLSKLPIEHLDLGDLVQAGLLINLTPFDPGQLERAMQQFELERVGGLP